MSGRDIELHPRVAWPRAMTAGQKYLVTVDLEHKNTEDWAYEEDCPITCVLTGSWQLDVRVIDSPTVVLHRFGGTYGPARFVVEAVENLTGGGAALNLTLVTAGGVPIRSDTLRIAPTSEPIHEYETVTVPLPAFVGQEIVEREPLEPTPGTCHAVLIGASRFRDYPDLPAVPNILKHLRQLLTSPTLGDLDPEDVTVVQAPTLALVKRAIREACSRPVEKLFIYFVGHVIRDPSAKPCFPLHDTLLAQPQSAISYDTISQMVERSPAAHTFLVFDCVDTNAPWTEPAPTGGQLIIGALEPAATRAGDFMNASLFIRVLTDGLPGDQQQLSLTDVYTGMLDRSPQQELWRLAFRSNTAVDVPFFKNRAWPSPRASGPEANRAVLIHASGFDGIQLGSGYLVTDSLILTSAHIVHGADSVDVRFATSLFERERVTARAVWVNPELDVAVLRVARVPDLLGALGEILPVWFGRVLDLADSEVVGYPRRARPRGLPPSLDGNDDISAEDVVHLTGTVRPLSGRPGGDLEFHDSPPLPYRSGGSSTSSSWDGMSGAAIWSDGCIVGVVNQPPRTGIYRLLSGGRIDRWYDALRPDDIRRLHDLIGLPLSPADLKIAEGRPSEPVNVLQQLPRVDPDFTGREAELELFRTAQAEHALDHPFEPRIWTIEGMAGVGKTAFVAHAARRMADLYPDGIAYISMHGHSPGRSPLHPADALATLLTRVGLEPGRMPNDIDARASLWRRQMESKRILLIFDDVASSEQVRPLLPTTRYPLVLITSRRRLSALEQARSLSLDVLPLRDATRLLARRSGRDERASEGDFTHLAELCGCLPLALTIVASSLRHNPGRSIPDLVRQLDDSADLIAAFSTEDYSLESVIGLSYRDLTVSQQHLFWLMGAHPGPDCGITAAAYLLELAEDSAKQQLDELASHHLIDEVSPLRYRMHNLVRLYAQKMGAAAVHLDDSAAAVERQLVYYEDTGRRMNVVIARYPRPAYALPDFVASVSDSPVAAEDALGWLRTERANLMACLDYAYNLNLSGHVVALTAAVSTLLAIDGSDGRAPVLHRRAADVAARIGDLLGEANALTDLGAALQETGDAFSARDQLELALGTYRTLDNRLGQANVLTELGSVWSTLGDYPRAEADLRDAVVIYRKLGERLGEANALAELGTALEKVGNFSEAASRLSKSVDIFDSILTCPLGYADALTRLGSVQMASGQFQRAARILDDALEQQRSFSYELGEAHAAAQLGRLNYSTGDYRAALQHLERALDVYLHLRRPRGTASTLLLLGVVNQAQGNHDQAIALLQRALESSRILDPISMANAMTCLGAALVSTGDLDEAERLQQEALRLFRDAGASTSEAVALSHLGAVYLERNEVSAAYEAYDRSWRIARELQARDCEAHALEGRAHCSYREGLPGEGLDRFNQASEIYRKLGMWTRVERIKALLERLERRERRERREQPE